MTFNYEYRPSAYHAFDLSDDEYSQMDEWAAQLYVPSSKDVPVQIDPRLERPDRGFQVTESNSKLVTSSYDFIGERLIPYLHDFSPTDVADLDSHLIMRSGHMLGVLVLICDRVWEKGCWTYMELYSRGHDPMILHNYGEPEYDSEDELINTDYTKEQFRVATVHVEVFCSYYSAGCRNGISGIVRESLFCQIYPVFDYMGWVESLHDNWKKKCVIDDGQTKIFLSSLRVFDKLPPGRITVLVIGSGSHPVRSGYTYPALARFLSNSGFNGVFHMFDPLENHITCQVGNFQMVYFPMAYVFGSAYKIEDAHPTVILDDLYVDSNSVDDRIISDDQLYHLVRVHTGSRVSAKYRLTEASQHQVQRVPVKVPNVTYCVSTQFSYDGGELRVYYRTPTTSIVRMGQWVGNMQCSQCWYYAGLICRIGCPKEDLSVYWRILYSLSGHHCTPVSGIKNIMILSALKHELSRGFQRDDAITNVVDAFHHPRYGVNYEKVGRVYDLSKKIDDNFIQLEKQYPPNHDQNFMIRERVTIQQILDTLSDHDLQFKIMRSSQYSSRKYEQLLEIYSEVDRSKYPVVDIVMYNGDEREALHEVIFVEDVRKLDLEGYDAHYSLGTLGIFVMSNCSKLVRFLFDRGREFDEHEVQ